MSPSQVEELRAALRAAVQRQQSQKRLVANIAHEFRTPLAAILGFVEILREGGLEDAKNRQRYLGTIERHARRLHWLIEDLLTLSRLDTDEPGLKPRPILLRPVAEATVRDLSELMRRKRLFVDLVIEESARAVADERYLLQVFENLLSNAIKYNRPGGWIRVSAEKAREGMVVAVSDGGCGVSAEDLPRIFERFYLGAHGTRESAGLGLYIVKRIVEAHGGRVWCESKPGEGASFRFTLPTP